MYLRGLTARIDQGAGWCGVFWQRDPEGMTACLDGREVPPWDVVEALLQDLAAAHGPERATWETGRARALYRASVRVRDAVPGGREALVDRIDVMTREQRGATDRLRELAGRLDAATTREDAEPVRRDLAWARDDYDRATARVAELRSRLADLGGTEAAPPTPRPRGGRADASPAPAAPAKKRKRGGARFAGLPEDDTPVPPAQPSTPAPEADVATPRGARFAGAEQDVPMAPAPPQVDSTARAHIAATVHTLVRHRTEGRSGDAHIVLVDAAHGPAAHLPPLAAELHRAGLGADWATLLWEAASLPPGRVVAVADALAAAGRDADARQLLRQGVARPPAEIGDAVGLLHADGRRREAQTLLDAYVRSRTPEEAARSAQGDPGRLVPLVAEAARAVSGERYRDVLHALRVAGLTV
ncbi:hypothetical protein ACIBL6_24340 [Streptomyces sp. NPDC050400]|uniref:hypothetical protein n=1 Tax=Streptomyces sp. NPDC050400 TaxID=3365610 RepID=UPI00379B974E